MARTARIAVADTRASVARQAALRAARRAAGRAECATALAADREAGAEEVRLGLLIAARGVLPVSEETRLDRVPGRRIDDGRDRPRGQRDVRVGVARAVAPLARDLVRLGLVRDVLATVGAVVQEPTERRGPPVRAARRGGDPV